MNERKKSRRSRRLPLKKKINSKVYKVKSHKVKSHKVKSRRSTFNFETTLKKYSRKPRIPYLVNPKTLLNETAIVQYRNPSHKLNGKIPKIAHCFLLGETTNHLSVWEEYFKQDTFYPRSYTIYSHLKSSKKSVNTPDWIERNRIPTIPTEWCGESLVFVWMELLKEALKDQNNQYFVLLSGDCIPLYNYNETYRRITSSKKSRINPNVNNIAYQDTGLYYADQWTILTRKHAKLLLSMKETKSGKTFLENTKKRLTYCDRESGLCYDYCPDELYPLNWFVAHYGKPYTSTFKKEFHTGPSTYTYWDLVNKEPHPEKFTLRKMRNFKDKICKSRALFARKFMPNAGKELGMKCRMKNKE
jgi:hypothetical protein